MKKTRKPKIQKLRIMTLKRKLALDKLRRKVIQTANEEFFLSRKNAE
jgi:hypothetical protein